VTGSEYLSSIVVYTTLSTTASPTQPGWVLLWQPMNPKLLSGTRISQLTKLYQHYRINEMTAEYVKVVPSIQDGSIGMTFTYDPVENWTGITSDTDTLMRTFMAHKGSNIGSVYDCLRAVFYKNEDTLKDYFTEEGEDARLEEQGSLVIVAASRFTPYDGEAEVVTLGNIILHYDITLHARDIEMMSSSVEKVTNVSASGQTWAQVFTSGTINVPLSFVAAFMSLIGVTVSSAGYYMFRILGTLTINSVVVGLNTIEGQAAAYAGAIFFGYCDINNGATYWVQNEGDAIEKNSEKRITLLSTLTTSQTAAFNMDVIFVPFV